jgi:hypothetical protein
MIGRAGLAALTVAAAALAFTSTTADAQSPPGATPSQGASERAALRARIEQRFDVLPLRDGYALRPKNNRDVRSVEITGDAVAIDGEAATGAELRRRLGADADLVLQLSYMSDADRRTLFAATPSPAAPPETVQPPPPPVVEPPEPPVVPRRDQPSRRRQIGDRDGIVRFGSSIEIRRGEVIDGDVVVVGGSVRVDGTVRGDVVAVGGNIDLGPEASIDDNVVVVGGRLERDPGARIGGRVQDVGVNWRAGDWSWGPPVGLWWGSMVGSAFALVGTLARLAVLCLLAALVVLLGRDYMERAATRAAAEPLKAGAIGFLAAMLFLPVLVITIVVLVVTIVGIPLLVLVPFAILGLVLVALVGFTAVANRIGHLLTARFGWSAENPYWTTVAGIVLLASPVLVARVIGLGGFPLFPITGTLVFIGLVAECAAWFVGFGAVALVRFDRRPAANV